MSYNKWNYVGSNPVNRTDPTGKCWYPNANNGGISYDFTDSSNLMCSWFINMLQNQGVNIPPDATPQNWLNSIPPKHQAIINAFIICPFQSNVFLGASNVEPWSVIKFYTKPQWEYYTSLSMEADVEFKLFGVGGALEFSCEESHNCTTGASFDLGPGAGISILGYKLELSAGLELNYDSTGFVQVGGTADIGVCSLFVNFLRISINCAIPPTMVHKEWGWTRNALPEAYWVLVKESAFGSWSYEEFAKHSLPFSNTSKIYSTVKATGTRDIAGRYLDVIDYVCDVRCRSVNSK